MKKIEFVSKYENGAIVRNRKTLLDAFKSFEGVDIVITIQKEKKQRSDPQNRYYWGCVVPLIQSGMKDVTGDTYSKEEVHLFLKSQFNYKEIVNEASGEVLRIPKSTTENSTTDMEAYQELIRRFALDFLNTIIPAPNEQLTIEI